LGKNEKRGTREKKKKTPKKDSLRKKMTSPKNLPGREEELCSVKVEGHSEGRIKKRNSKKKGPSTWPTARNPYRREENWGREKL